jgi:hypothetical protein
MKSSEVWIKKNKIILYNEILRRRIRKPSYKKTKA